MNKEMNIQITVAPESLNSVLEAIRATGFRHVELDQIEDAVRVSLKVMPTDVSQVLSVIEGARKPTTGAAYEALSKFASGRARNRHGQFVPMQGRKGSHMMRKTGT